MEHVEAALVQIEAIGSAYIDVFHKYGSVGDALVWEFGLLERFLLETPVFPLLLMAHACFAANAVHTLTGGRQHWIKSLVLTFCVAFGGSTLACILAGYPTPISTAPAGNQIALALVSAWWLVNQSAPFRMLYRSRPFAIVAVPLAILSKCRAIFAFVDRIAMDRPQAIAAAVLLGGLSGSGGSLFASLENKWRRGPETPSELSNPRWGSKSAFIIAAVYYLTTDPAGVLGNPIPVDNAFAAVAIASFMMLQAVVEIALRRDFNPLYYLEEIGCALLRLHIPDNKPKPASTAAGFVAKNAPKAKKRN